MSVRAKSFAIRSRSIGPIALGHVLSERLHYGCKPWHREERYVSAMLAMAVGEGNYPGDLTPSDNWPGIAPGTRGVNNALAPAWGEQAALATIAPQPPILWLRGADDQIVSDTSLFDFGFLGQLGAVPAWPGKEIYPPQPMIGQLRAVLETYRGHGGAIARKCWRSAGIRHTSRNRRSSARWSSASCARWPVGPDGHKKAAAPGEDAGVAAKGVTGTLAKRLAGVHR